MAPWSHTYLSPQSERRMCCASREKADWATQYLDSEDADKGSTYNPGTLDDHWNSEYMKGIRRDLMAGKEIPQCQVCNNQLLNVSIYRDYFNKTLFPNKIEEAFEKTRDDGYTDMKPISFDYRIKNLCNFKCRMCGDQLSSSWEAERRMMGDYDQEENTDFWARKENKPAIETFQRDVAEAELWKAVKDGTIEEIYWVGGEPLMWEIHWEIMQYLIDHDLAKNVWIRYNSNFSRSRYKLWDLRDMLPHFKMVQMCASIDGIGEIGEFVRYGFKQRVFERNLIKWLKFFENKKATIYYHYACHIMNVFNYDSTFEYLSQFDGEMYLSMVERPKYLNLKYLPEQTKKWIEKQITNKSIKSHLWSDKFDNKNVNDFLKYIYFLEEHRNTIPKEIENIFDAIVGEL